MSRTDPSSALSARDILSQIIALHDEVNARGILCEAPDDITDAMDAAYDAVINALEWFVETDDAAAIAEQGIEFPDGYGDRWAL